MLTGKVIALRAIETPDLPQLQEWRNNKDMRKYYREYRELNMYNQETWYKNICCGNPNFCMFCIIDKSNNKLLGVCGLTNINWVIRSAELSFYIGHNDLYIDETYAPDAVSVMLDYAFNELNMHKAWAEIYDFDEKKKKLFENMKFNKDGELRDNVFIDGKYKNSLIYSIINVNK